MWRKWPGTYANMLLIQIICILLTIAYLLLMVAYRIGWQKQADFILPLHYRPNTHISVIIPARNEAANIGACVDAILAQNYPTLLYEIIVVDDHSDDATAAIVRAYNRPNVRSMRLADVLTGNDNTNSYKKLALSAGIAQSSGQLIVTTDADCIAPAEWLMNIAAIYEQQQPVMIVAPVIFSSDNSAVQLFQLTDFMSMQGITAAAHALRLGNMSNGANLAFSKAAFNEVAGYDGIQHLASGDDYLLMMKMSRIWPNSIAYLKTPHAIVSTSPQPDWEGFLQQRIRWASKSGKYNDAKLTCILLLVYLFNLSLLVVGIGAFFSHTLLYAGLVMLAAKIVAEYWFIIPVARFFNCRRILKYFPLLQPLHIIYIITAGLLGLLGGYEWKGRRVK